MLRAGFDVYFFTLTRLDSISAGSALAIFFREPLGIERMLPWLRRSLPFFIAGLAMLFVWNAGGGNYWIQVFKYTLYAFLCFSVVVAALIARSGGWVESLFTNAFLAMSGRYSYGLYILHPFIFSAVNVAWPHLSMSPAFFVASSFSFVAAWLSWYTVENNFLKLKNYFPVIN